MNEDDKIVVEELAETNPKLREVCVLAGGPQNVYLERTEYEDTGNSVLRGETMWKVKALGNTGCGFRKHGDNPLEQAAGNWLATYRVYPKSKTYFSRDPELFLENKS